VKKFFSFLWRATIPILWLLSVLAVIRGGFQPGLVWLPPPGEIYSFSYPWVGVILTSVVTAIECAFLYFVLRPDRLIWSLPRVSLAFAIFFLLSILVAFTTVTDQPGYAYIPGDLILLLTLLLFMLLIITAIVRLVHHFSSTGQAK
jgi:hypothetical protein